MGALLGRSPMRSQVGADDFFQDPRAEPSWLRPALEAVNLNAYPAAASRRISVRASSTARRRCRSTPDRQYGRIGTPRVVLDLATCEFLDAGALGVIVGLELQLAARGQELVVDGATGQVKRLIDLARAISRQVRPPALKQTARP